MSTSRNVQKICAVLDVLPVTCEDVSFVSSFLYWMQLKKEIETRMGVEL